MNSVAETRFRPSKEIAAADLRWQAQALLDDGFRLALVTAQPEDGGHRVVYLFTAPRPDRRIELIVRTDRTRTLPSLALQSFPAGRFERQLYTDHGLLASSGLTRRPAPPSPGSEYPESWERRAVGQPLAALLPRVESMVPNSGVAHGLALCLAIEDAYDRHVPGPVGAARAVLLEIERLQNHLHAIAVMCARGGLAKWAAEAITLRRTVADWSQKMSGDLLLAGAVRPGGLRITELPSDYQLEALQAEADEFAYFAVTNASLIGTYRGRWTLTREHVAQTGALGFVARASGVDVDARRDHPFHPGTARVSSVTADAGDAFARLEVRVRELLASIRLIRALTPVAAPSSEEPFFEPPGVPLRGIGLVEGPHGTIASRLEISPDGTVANIKVVDPSFLTRSVLTVCQRGPHDAHGSMVESGFDLPADSR